MNNENWVDVTIQSNVCFFQFIYGVCLCFFVHFLIIICVWIKNDSLIIKFELDKRIVMNKNSSQP